MKTIFKKRARNIHFATIISFGSDIFILSPKIHSPVALPISIICLKKNKRIKFYKMVALFDPKQYLFNIKIPYNYAQTKL